ALLCDEQARAACPGVGVGGTACAPRCCATAQPAGLVPKAVLAPEPLRVAYAAEASGEDRGSALCSLVPKPHGKGRVSGLRGWEVTPWHQDASR
ncbi:hypothetical protein LEMLEM_LOCUS17321, partial [Lemmus lemmus]